MADFVETVGLGGIIREAGANPEGNFEAIYSHLHKHAAEDVLEKLDEAIRAYFSQLQLPDENTLYDRLILSLKPKDLIVSFNFDPLLVQAFKRWRHLGGVLPKLAFLHGNVDVGIDLEKKAYGFLSDGSTFHERQLTPTTLLYPIEQKNYNSNPFIADQWTLATTHIEEAYLITVFGYSAPKTDVEARSLLLRAWDNNPTRELAEIDIFDIRDPREVKDSWADFIVNTHGGASTDFGNSILMHHPRRSCEAFAFATLQQRPWHEDPILQGGSLGELETWIKPLIEEEVSGKLDGKPLHAA